MGMPLIPSCLMGARNIQKRGFYSIFVVGGDNFRIIKFSFLAFFEAKMTRIVILDQKLIVSNDYLQFWVHFEWFLSLFQILDVKYLFSLFKLKIRKNRTFWSKILFFENFSMVIWSPTPSYVKKIGSKWPLNRFL